jgi:hypothetical protein
MKNHEHLNLNKNSTLRKTAAVVLLGISSLTLFACGDNETDNQPNRTDSVEQTGVNHIYFDDGSRLTEYRDSDNYADIKSFCDGHDLVDQTEFKKDIKKAAGNSVERSVGHPACTDGVLTPSDFHISG